MQPFSGNPLQQEYLHQDLFPMGRLDACIWFRRSYAVAAEISFECGIRNICLSSIDYPKHFERMGEVVVVQQGLDPMANCPQKGLAENGAILP